MIAQHARPRAIAFMVLSLVLNCAIAMDTNQTADGLTLGAAIRMAQARNPGYQSAVTAHDVANADYAATRGERLPRAELFGSYLYSPINNELLIQGFMQDGILPSQQSYSQICTLGVRLRYPLYTGGSVDAEPRRPGSASTWRILTPVRRGKI